MKKRLTSGAFALACSALFAGMLGFEALAQAFEIVPEPESKVTELQEFTVTYTGAEEVVFNTSNMPYLSLEGVKKSTLKNNGWSVDGDQVTLRFAWASTVGGSWTLTLPAGMVTVDGTESEESVINYTIAPISYAFNPSSYDVSIGFDSFAIEFEGCDALELADPQGIVVRDFIEETPLETAFSSVVEGTVLKVDFENPLPRGLWEVYVQPGTLLIDGVPFMQEITKAYKVPAAYSVTPAANSAVPEIGEVRVVFEGIDSLEIYVDEYEDEETGEIVTEIYMPEIVDAMGSTLAEFNVFEAQGNTLVMRLDEPYTTEGECFVSVPGYSYDMDGAMGEYLYLPYTIDHTAVGVATVTVTRTPDGIYTLDGRKLSTAPERGLYIRDGRKLIVR